METAELILKYIEALIWPFITVFILLYFKEELSKLLGRAKKVELPGGISIEAFENKLEQAKQLEKEIKQERKPEVSKLINQQTRKDSEANRRMFELGLRPSPSGLELNYYRDIAKTDIKLSMAGLRMDLELMIRNLADGFKYDIDPKMPIRKLIKLLHEKGAIDSKQAEFIEIIFQLTNYAMHGGEVTEDQFDTVLELGNTLIEDYIAWLDWGFKD